MSPLRRAVRDLLLVLDGSVQQVDGANKETDEDAEGEPTATCFLVYGERGTGKTTVLLSARDAVCNPAERFFSMKEKSLLPERGKESCFRLEAQSCARRLRDRGAIWLDVLNLESLPRTANLLTTMLTRVLCALDARGGGRKTLEISTIVEEGTESARQQLTGLIRDATLMWEDIIEQNTRDKANRQMAAATIYAEFRHRFKKAVKALSKELGVSGSREESHPIILPIDNIDRSTEHLHGIFKLAQMVSSPYLWLVLAGDREDVETFLERAYWKELITVGEGAGGVGKVGLGKEDEALVMARRQAAAASHKLLPPSHRIEVEMVKPNEALEFHRFETGKSIYDLLASIVIPNNTKEGMPLIDMLDAGKHSKGPIDRLSSQKLSAVAKAMEQPERKLTRPANMALQLPARGVLDLWQQVDRLCNDVNRFTGSLLKVEDDYRAEKIARTMLRNAIAESNIPCEMGLYLQDKIIYKEPDGSTTLKFCDPNPTLRVSRRRAAQFQRRLNTAVLPEKWEKGRYAVRSGIAVLGNEEVLVCSLARGADELELPPVVAGWLLVLHDVVVEASRSWVIKSNVVTDEVRFVSAQHDIVSTAGKGFVRNGHELWWPAPQWETCLAHDVLWVRWNKFVSAMKDDEGGLILRADYMAWVLAVGWIACVLDTFTELDAIKTGLRVPDSELKEKRLVSVVTDLAGISQANEEVYCAAVIKRETRVLTAAGSLYVELMKGTNPRRKDEKVFVEQKRSSLMRYWLEQKMPLLLSHLYVPLCQDAGDMRQKNLKEILGIGDKERKRKAEMPEGDVKDPLFALGEAWRSNFPFIFADYHTRLSEMFPGWEMTQAEAERHHTGSCQKNPAELRQPDPGELGGFGDLFRLLNSIPPREES